MNELMNLHPDKNAIVDQLQVVMAALPQAEATPSHTFLPGLYIREIIMSAGTGGVSKVHASAHPVFVCGQCEVYDSLSNEVVKVHGYWKGITQPGTRRVFNIIADTIITTVHPVPFITGDENGLSDIEKEALVLEIEKLIIEPHEPCHF